MQKAVRRAARETGITKSASCRTLRPSFAPHLLAQSTDSTDVNLRVRTVQDLLGHDDLRSTQIYTHVLRSGRAGTRSPLDTLG